MSQSASAIAATIQNPDREMTTTERISQLETMVVQLCEGIAERDETIEAQQAQLDDQQEQLDDKQAQINDLKAKLETETERRKSVESELEDLADDCEWLNDILFDLEDDLFGEYQSTIALNELGADSLIEYLLEDHTETQKQPRQRTRSSATHSGRSCSGPVRSLSANSRRMRPSTESRRTPARSREENREGLRHHVANDR